LRQWLGNIGRRAEVHNLARSSRHRRANDATSVPNVRRGLRPSVVSVRSWVIASNMPFRSGNAMAFGAGWARRSAAR